MLPKNPVNLISSGTNGNNMCRKCEGNCGLWVLKKNNLKKNYAENIKKKKK